MLRALTAVPASHLLSLATLACSSSSNNGTGGAGTTGGGGTSVTFTFPNPGFYAYFCDMHSDDTTA